MNTFTFESIPYTRPKPAEITAQYEALFAELDRSIADLALANAAITKWNQLRSSLATTSQLVAIRYHQDTSDPTLQEEKKFLDDLEPTLRELDLGVGKRLLAHPLRPDMENKWGKQIFAILHAQVQTFLPEIADDLRSESELARRYTDLLAQAQVEFAGNPLTLSELRKFTSSTDRRERMEAQRVKSAFFKANECELDTLYAELVACRQRMAKKLGYSNFIPLGYGLMTRTDYTSADVARFREEILRDIVPLALALRERQRQTLGLDHLYFYDEPILHPHGNPKPKGDTTWIIGQTMRMMSDLSTETRAFFEMMMSGRLLDLAARPNKAGGGFCTELPDYRVPFIFANFNGTAEDISTFTHECGHAFQSYMSRDAILIDYLFPTLEACEIHSMGMEVLTFPYMDRFFGEEAPRYCRDHLIEAIVFLPYAAAVDEFQHLVYEHPEFSAHDRKHCWQEMEKKYLPWRDYAGLPHVSDGGLWQGQSHIYTSPFYYIDYAIAQTCALQLWQRAQLDHGRAFSDFVALCRPGGSLSFTELIAEGNLISPFEPGCLRDVVETVKKQIV